MTINTNSIPFNVPARNRQAKATVLILNIVRWLSVALAALVCVAGVVSSFDSDSYVQAAGVGMIFGSLVYGALAYAFIGWLVDTLDMLIQIARNTSRWDES